MATKTAEAEDQEQTPAESQDGPVLDLSDAAVKKLIKTAKARGFVTYDELNAVLPSEEVSSEQIEDTMSMLSDMGINVVESEEAEEDARRAGEEGAAEKRRAPWSRHAGRPVRDPRQEPTERTDDPVRMYLREMGSVELLSREGEIAIAKRIEAGREAMIAGLCESPLTFQAIIIWRDELNERQDPAARHHRSRSHLRGPRGQGRRRASRCPARRRAGEAAADGQAAPASRQPARAPTARTRSPSPSEFDDDEDDLENALSLAAMEAELKPQGARDLRPHRRHLQEAAQAAGQDGRARAQERAALAPARRSATTSCATRSSATSSGSRSTTTASRAWSSSSTTSTSACVALEGRLLRLAESYGVPRQDFLDEYSATSSTRTGSTASAG